MQENNRFTTCFRYSAQPYNRITAAIAKTIYTFLSQPEVTNPTAQGDWSPSEGIAHREDEVAGKVYLPQRLAYCLGAFSVMAPRSAFKAIVTILV